MFRERDPRQSLWLWEFLITPKKAERMERTWAEVFRREALPLIDEERFAPMYSEGVGRPNRAVETVLGVLVLKEMFDLTDVEALEELEFNLLWQHALRLDIEEAHLPQKTLHNFRVRLMEHDGGLLAFRETTDRMIGALGVGTGKQRLDSTHIVSNIARLTRLGLFCETVRVFLLALRRTHPGMLSEVGAGLRGRYLKESGESSGYEDARSEESRRRLGVCARDVHRLVDRFRGTAAAGLAEYGLLERLLVEQCDVGGDGGGGPGEDDGDGGEEGVRVALKAPAAVGSDTLQTPHDAEVTYSGHKGKGYEVQVSETCGEGNRVQLITHVEVTPSSGSDAGVVVGMIEGLAERGIRPLELWADTSYGSGRNGWEAERLGTELVSPVKGGRVSGVGAGEEVQLGASDFEIDVWGERSAVCPAGHEAIAGYEEAEAPERVELRFAEEACGPCPLRSRCPVRRRGGVYVLRADLVRVNLERRRAAMSEREWWKRYGLRAGIEGTNSELKRAHGLGRLRVRGGQRVRLAVYLKALACNVKRMVMGRLAELAELERSAREAAVPAPVVMAA